MTDFGAPVPPFGESPPVAADQPYYFAVSVPKLLVMSVASFGLYQIYWHYQNWKRYRARSTSRFSVLLRTFLGPLFAFRLFERINYDLHTTGLRALPEPGVLALVYLGLNACLSLPPPWFTLGFLTIVPLLAVQAGVNRLHEIVAPAADRNDRYSGANVLLIVFGSLLFALMLVGLFAPVPDSKIDDAVPVVVRFVEP